MKNMKKTHRLQPYYLFIIAGLITIFMGVSCESQEQEAKEGAKEIRFKKDILYVERQTAHLNWDFSLTADLPIEVVQKDKTPNQFQDSVKAFLNREIHNSMKELCEEEPSVDENSDEYDLCSSFYSLEEQLSSTYQGKIEHDGGYWTSFILLAQTDSFVTYGVENYYCGGGCGSHFYCYTFSKKDGHRIKDIITWEDILRFIKDHPKASHPFGQWDIEADPKSVEYGMDYDIGLLDEELLLVCEDLANHYNLAKISYKDILPYLSKEAQDIVKAMGEGKAHAREEWFLGKCIGEIPQKDKPTIRLMQREPLWTVFSNLNCDDEASFYNEHEYTLTAYEETKEAYTPLELFDLEVSDDFSKALCQWAEDTRATSASGSRYCSRLEYDSSNAIWDDDTFEGECFILDNDVLLAPFKKKDDKVDIAPFKYDGRHFKIVKPNETKPAGEKLGTISLDGDETIYLAECGGESFKTNVPGIGLIANAVKAYYVKNGLYIPASIFPYHQRYLRYLPGDEPLMTSNPSHGFTAFDPKEEKLYIMIAERTSLGGYGCFDRYSVYQFKGDKFFYEGEDGGYWLHPSLRKYGRLFEVLKTKDYLVRIDEMRSYDWRGMNEEDNEASAIDTCRYRYAAWKHKDNMLDAPDLVIENGHIGEGGYVFFNEGHKYVVGDKLHVYKGDQLVLNQELDTITSIIW